MWADRSAGARAWHSGPAGNRLGKTAHHGARGGGGPLGGDPETWLVGLELEIPGNFWGIEYAPTDWKIEEIPSPAAEEPRLDQESSAAAKPARSRRWPLTDISAGACYLETAAPFPADTP